MQLVYRGVVLILLIPFYLQAMQEQSVDWMSLPNEALLHIASFIPPCNAELSEVKKTLSPWYHTCRKGREIAEAFYGAKRRQLVAINNACSKVGIGLRNDYLIDLLTDGPNKVSNTSGATALHRVVEHNEPGLMRMLLDQGAEVDIRDNLGRTPLFYTQYLYKGEPYEAMELLFKGGASINATNSDSETLLHVNARYGKSSMVEFLLKHGASKDVVNNIGATPLWEALHGGFDGSVQTAEILIKHGADVNVHPAYQPSPLKLAQLRGYTNIVNQLLARGAHE